MMDARRIALALLLAVPSVAMAEAMSAWIYQINSLMSAVKVVTGQTNSAADKASSMRMQGAQALGSSMVDIYNVEQVRKSVAAFGQTGQLVDPCYQISMANAVATATDKTSTSALGVMQKIYATSDSGRVNAGGVSGLLGGTVKGTSFPYAAQVSQRISRHLGRYCTVSESAQGYCTLNANGMQGADADFSVHLTPGKTYGWDQTEAAADFIKTVAPVKPMPRAGACDDAQCRSALAARRTEEAYLSMARFSFMRFVEAHTTQLAGDARKPAPQP